MNTIYFRITYPSWSGIVTVLFIFLSGNLSFTTAIAQVAIAGNKNGKFQS